MSQKKLILIPIVVILVITIFFTGCVKENNQNGGQIKMTITQPQDEEDLDLGNITIKVEVANFTLVNKLGQSNFEGEGHIIYFRDVDPPTNPGQPAVTAPETYAATIDTTYIWADLATGHHILSAELVNNDNTPLDPPVIDIITITIGRSKEYNLVSGWYKDQEIKYYDFGANTSLVNDKVLTAPIYVLVNGFNQDGTAQVVSGQYKILDVIPGDKLYSGLWKVNYVTVPSDYQPNSIKSVIEIMQNDYEITETKTLVNCPIVPAGSTFETGHTLVQGWYKYQKVYYPDFGIKSDYTAPIYVLITGFNDEGNPQLISGQKNIINVIPGDEDYSDFWRVTFVTVPQDYIVNTFKSAEEVINSGYPMQITNIIVNYPVVITPVPSVSISLSAKNYSFNVSQITVPAGAIVNIEFLNQDPGIPHNFAVYETSAAINDIFIGDIINGVSSTTYTFCAPSTPGTYFFRCDVYPSSMKGEFIVK